MSSTIVYCVVLAIAACGSLTVHAQNGGVFGDVKHTENGGTVGTIGSNANIFKNDAGHRLDAHGQISKSFEPRGPIQYGGGLDYTGPKAGASVDVNHARNFGTGVSANGHANIFESRDHRSRLDATANYQQHFGPRSRPDVGAGLRFTHNFGR